MRRYQWFEFCDQSWLPASVREGFHDGLGFIHRLFQPYHHLVKPLAEWAARTCATALLDLASGNAGHAVPLLDAAGRQGIQLPRLVISDLYPNEELYRRMQRHFGSNRIDYIAQPVSVLEVPDTSIRHWTIFTAFHHLAPPQAKQLLAQAIAKSDGLCIVELTRRRWLDLVMMPLALPVHMLAPFFAERFTWTKFLLTTLIPVIPLMIIFDGMVSVLRSYEREEVMQLLHAISGRENFTVDYGEAPWRLLPLKASLLTLTRTSG